MERLQTLKNTDPYIKKSCNNVISSAEKFLDTEPVEYDNSAATGLKRDGVNKMPVLAMAYNLTKDERYARRLWEELETVCAYSDWGPYHFLDVGDFARCVAYAYDWMYDYWTDSQKRIIRNAIVRNGFKPAMLYWRQEYFFFTETSNWNQVINSGLGMAALVIADEPGYEEIGNEVLNRTIDALPNGLSSFAPDGACMEGVSYWEYAKQTFFQYNASLYQALGTDYGLSDMEGLSKTGYFPILIAGSTKTSFNFGDAYGALILDPVMFWIARRYDHPEITGYVLEMQPAGGSWAALGMYRPDHEFDGDFRDSMPKDFFFRGPLHIATMRSSWHDSDALFVAFKGANTKLGHGDLDAGTFVLDALGVRWAVDLGSEDYSHPGMFDTGAGGQRWTYYRKRAEGNNTLVINPDAKDDQKVGVSSEITKFETSDGAVYGIIDMQPAYQDRAADVKRGIALIHNRSAVLVQDEIKTSKPSDIYSFIHTMASIEIADGGKRAIMSSGGQRMCVDLLEPAAGTLMEMEAGPMDTSPKQDANMNNAGYRKLAVKLTKASDPRIALLFTPLKTGQSEADITLPAVKPLSEWSSYLGSSSGLTSLSVNGVPVTGFSTFNTSYTLTEGIVGRVTAEAASGSTAEITQAKRVGDSAFITVRMPDESKLNYSVTFAEKVPAVVSERTPYYEIKGVRASEVPQPENPPESAIDNDFGTRWSAEGEQWLEIDLGEALPVSGLMMACFSGATRKSIFSIETSGDGQSWTKVYSGESSGKTEDFETYEFEKTYARYVRVAGSGNSQSKWNSITEVQVPIPPVEYADMTGHWARKDVDTMSSVGIVKGISEDYFAPEDTVTRAEFAAMAARALGLSEKEYAGSFSDTADGWYSGILEAAKEAGIIPDEMVTDGCFNPDAHITREEMCAIIVRGYEGDKMTEIPTYGLPFEDGAAASEWARIYIEKGISLRVIAGVSETEFMPRAEATRAQAAVLIKRLFYKMNL